MIIPLPLMRRTLPYLTGSMS